MICEPHEFIHPAYHRRAATGGDAEAAFDALTARVLATPDGKRWLDELQSRSILSTFLIAEIETRIRRERERWRTGALTPS